MARKSFMVLTLCLCLLAACSNSHSNSGGNSSANLASEDMRKNNKADMAGSRQQAESAGSQELDHSAADTSANHDAVNPQTKRMVIYDAEMSITVREFKKARNDIRALVIGAGGYVVQSSLSDSEDGRRTGTITARVPQSGFQTILGKIEDIAKDVEMRSVHGKDVTKRYVDLQSRLEANIAVKKRLESFLKKAKDSEDLLNISDHLADVQENIEHIKGEMKYLENHSALATVTVHMAEENAEIKQQEDLDTWEKTENAFIDSINIIVTFFSALVIFLIGYSPIFIPVVLIAALIYLVYKRKRKPGA